MKEVIREIIPVLLGAGFLWGLGLLLRHGPGRRPGPTAKLWRGLGGLFAGGALIGAVAGLLILALG